MSRRRDTWTHSGSWRTGDNLARILWSEWWECLFREPKNRATWLKIWYNTIEKLEKENPWALAFNEEEEIDTRSKALWICDDLNCWNLLHLDCEEFVLKGGECYEEMVSGYKYKKWIMDGGQSIFHAGGWVSLWRKHSNIIWLDRRQWMNASRLTQIQLYNICIQKRTKVFLTFILLYCQFYLCREELSIFSFQVEPFPILSIKRWFIHLRCFSWFSLVVFWSIWVRGRGKCLAQTDRLFCFLGSVL